MCFNNGHYGKLVANQQLVSLKVQSAHTDCKCRHSCSMWLPPWLVATFSSLCSLPVWKPWEAALWEGGVIISVHGVVSFFTIMVVVGLLSWVELLLEVSSSSEVPQLHRWAKLVVSTSQTQPTPAWITFAEVDWVWLGLACWDYEIGSEWQNAVHIVRKPVARCISSYT